MSELGAVLSGRFRLDERVGAGGAGVVFRATDLERNVPVAVKLLHGGGDFDRRRFDREVAILRELDHPHIVRFEATGYAPDHGSFLVMEWLDGETLTQRLKRGRLSESESLTLGIGLAEALECVHAHGIVHRDVKPSNVWLAGGDPAAPRLIDFGISKSGSHESITRTGEAFGTIGYMAPEQVCADQPVDLRADIFSLGCVLFECVTGTLPFRAETPQGWLMKLALEDALRADHVSPGVSQSLSDVLARMLEVQPTARTPSMSEVQSALRLARTSELVMAESRRGPAIGMLEQRFATLLLLGSGEPAEVSAVLSARAAYHGGLLHQAAGGAVVAFTAPEAPAELARAAVRLASETLAVWPGGKLLVISVRMTPGSRWVGDAYDRAERMLSGLGHGLTADEATHGLIRGSFECTPLGEGRGFEVATKHGGSKRGRLRMASASPFVGRERELEMLLDAYRGVLVEQKPSIVLLTGGAGIGKSRIANEARARIRTDPSRPTILLGSADDGDAPYALLLAMLERYLGLSQRSQLQPAARRAELRQAIARVAPASESELLAELLAELFVGPSDEPSPALLAARAEARLMKDQLARAFGTLLRAIIASAPVVMVIEHLERIDAASAILLDRFVAVTTRARLLLIATARPELRDRFPSLFAEAASTSVTVAELPRAAATTLARALLGPRSAELERTLDLSGQNPLFIEELARSVREGAATLPESILALSQSRLDRLNDRERRFLRAASVFGRRFPIAGAASLLASKRESDTARSLVEAGVVRVLGDEDLELASATLREVLYGSIPERELKGAHKAAARFLESSNRAGANELARHWEIAGDSTRARPWLLRAAREALAAGDLAGAASLGEKAERTSSAPAELAAARVLRAEVSDLRWDWADAETHARGAMEVLEAGSVLWFVAAQVMMRVYMRTKRRSELFELVATIRATEPGDGARNSAALAVAVAANSLAISHDPDADITLERMEALIEPLPPHASARAWAVLARGGRALVAGDIGLYHDTRREAAERFDRLYDSAKALEAWGSAAYANALLGRYELGEQISRRAIEVAEDHHLATVHYLRHNLGYILLGSGRYEEARIELERTLEPLAKAHPHLLRGSQRYLSRALVALGDLAAAERMSLAALVTSDRPSTIAPGQADLAHVLLARGDLAEARTLAEDAAAGLSAEGAFNEDEMFIRLTQARVRRAAGDHAASLEAARAATTRLLHLAQKIVDPGARASFLASVPDHRQLTELARAVSI